jgi:hypothetical protein
VPGWQTRSGSKSGAATASSRRRPMLDWHTSNATSNGTTTASGIGRHGVSKICTQQLASPFQNLMRPVFRCLT